MYYFDIKFSIAFPQEMIDHKAELRRKKLELLRKQLEEGENDVPTKKPV